MGFKTTTQANNITVTLIPFAAESFYIAGRGSRFEHYTSNSNILVLKNIWSVC